ncbi:MAG: histidine phosphatase family protein [Saprospiraceae bacterium]|nr:histidine phosphatase family protein [Saprospiraceae bacterium]
MKTVYFVRHAKSSWDNPGLTDRERPLNQRGKRDAPFMAKLLKGQDVHPDKLVSSPANRAFTTASYFAEAFGLESADILVIQRIYEAYSDDLLDIIRHLSDEWNTILIFGHNPTFTEVVNRFSNNYIANIPTCGIERVDDSVERWRDFGSKAAGVKAFYYPKQYFE